MSEREDLINKKLLVRKIQTAVREQLLSCMEIQINKAVRSAFYKSALSHNQQPCAGFVLGSRQDFDNPRFEFALIAIAAASWNGLTVESLVAGLNRHLDDGRQLAGKFQRDVMGVGIAWDRDFARSAGNRHAQFGLLVDFACRHEIDFVLEVPVDGGDSFWGCKVYYSQQFPGDSLSCKMVSHRPIAAIDNPKRIKRAWREILGQDN